MNKTQMILSIINDNPGTKTCEVCNMMGWKQSTVSGILSTLKSRGEVKNINGEWYTCKKLDIKKYLLDISRGLNESPNNAWSEGVIVGCLLCGKINNDEYDDLFKWLKGFPRIK